MDFNLGSGANLAQPIPPDSNVLPRRIPTAPGPVLEQGHTKSLQQEEEEQLLCVGHRPEPTGSTGQTLLDLTLGEVGKLTGRYTHALGTLVYPGGGTPKLPANTSDSGHCGTPMPQPVCAASMGHSL